MTVTVVHFLPFLLNSSSNLKLQTLPEFPLPFSPVSPQYLLICLPFSDFWTVGCLFLFP